MKHRINQKDIARLANVCQSTVSAVLNPHGHGNTKVSEETRALILKIAEEHHYRPNMQSRQLRGNASSGLVGVITNPQISQFFYDILLPLENELHARHKRMIIGLVDNDTEETQATLENFSDYNLDGIIVLHHDIVNAASLFSHYAKDLPPMVFLDPPDQLPKARVVSVDYASGLEEAVLHLGRHGRHRIALCMNDTDHLAMRQRLAGYRSGLQKLGLAADPELLFISPADSQEALAQLMERAARQLAFTAHADAIIGGNDLWALALQKALLKLHVTIPDEVALVGYGNTINICQATTPELASVDHCPADLARSLVTSLFEPNSMTQPIHTKLIPRASAGTEKH